MLFNSYIFIFLFLPITLGGYYILNKYQKYALAEYFLIIMSLLFYGYFNYKYLAIILASIVINYLLVQRIWKTNNQNKKKLLMIIGCIINVGILFYFKYMNFFIQNVNNIFGSNFLLKDILLPIGISFFTFQQLSYVIDNYKNNIEHYSFRKYALFVSFFPQLIAGPIVLHDEMLPQFADISKKTFQWSNFSKGLMAFSLGLAKKVLIADNLGCIANYGFSNIAILGSANAILVMLSYTFQIYFDFSGYCDMATGIAKLFNIDLPQNFNSPYQALTVTEFWKRWHMTLTRFLRTYIYFPLGGNRKGKGRTYINLFLVFFISGLWHGANYTFLIWGMMHGIAMVIERIFKNKISRLSPVLSWLFTFSFINIAWIFFRAENITDALLLIKQILNFDFIPINTTMISQSHFDLLNFLFSLLGRIGIYFKKTHYVYILISILIILLLCKNTNEKLEEFKPTIKNALISSLLFVLSIMSFSGVSIFLYFNF